jgi:AraC-like DNA-binding protein
LRGLQKIARIVISRLKILFNFKFMFATTINLHDQTIQAVKAFIQNNLDSDLGLCSLSRHFGISPFHLSRIFKQLNGATLADYVNNKRLENSLECVLYSPATLIEIAVRYGFNNYETLSRRFKEKYEISPGDLRNLLRFLRSRDNLAGDSRVILLTGYRPLEESEVRDMTGIPAISRMKLVQIQLSRGRKAFQEKFKFYNT